MTDFIHSVYLNYSTNLRQSSFTANIISENSTVVSKQVYCFNLRMFYECIVLELLHCEIYYRFMNNYLAPSIHK